MAHILELHAQRHLTGFRLLVLHHDPPSAIQVGLAATVAAITRLLKGVVNEQFSLTGPPKPKPWSGVSE